MTAKTTIPKIPTPNNNQLGIYAFSPAGAVRDKTRFALGVSNLEASGYTVKLDRSALAAHQRFAGTDEQRCAAFDRASQAKEPIAMISRGGYGITRLLPLLDYKRLGASVANGKKWVGFSDFTAFQLAMLAKAKATTYAGPALVEFGVEVPDDLTLSLFGEVMRYELELIGFQTKRVKAYEGFEASGTLWGGNLSVLCSLQGSEYFPKVRGGILMLEETGETPYKIERLLTQLLHSGVLDSQKAVMLGYFNQYKLSAHDDGFDMPSILKWLRSKTKTPIITGLPMGHDPLNFTLPHGAKIGLAIEGTTCYLLLH
jgi:muramoyltetrapeptide carboxypeptidase